MRIATFAVLAVAAWLFVVASVGRSAPVPTPAQIAIYMRGWIDGAAPPGVFVNMIGCKRSVGGYRCVAHLTDGSCAAAIVHGYAFAGPVARCPGKHAKGPGA